jgi:hypothetical protein
VTDARWKFLLSKIETLELAHKMEQFVEVIEPQTSDYGTTAQLDRFLEWSRKYAAPLRSRCSLDNIEAALSATGLLKPENNGFGN